MTDDSNTPPEEGPSFIGEEEEDERSTPGKNLGAAIFIGLLSILAMALSLRMPNPTTIYTAPGLLPFLTGLSLLAMAVALGVMALRQGAAENFFDKTSLAWHAYFGDEENERTLFLIGIIFVYVFLVDMIGFDKEFSIGGLSIFFSSYELISIAALSLILRIFWQAPLLNCLGVSFAVVVALASAFRYGFKILLPGLA